MIEVALSLSGGGYRAAMFHLGTLMYLQSLKIPQAGTFLENVRSISTISGGSLTGLWYMMHKVKGADLDVAFRDLYRKLRDCNVMKEGMDRGLSRQDGTLIGEMVNVYDREFFNGASLGQILDYANGGDVHHFIAGSTDFVHGLPFRFQASREIVNAPPKFKHGFIGNNSFQVPWDVAHDIKLSEIMAASSCFPGVFEPINFPSDFSFSKKGVYEEYITSLEGENIPLMDGGVVDNQGIEALLLANRQMQKDNPRAQDDKNFVCHDLMIVSDVTVPSQQGMTLPNCYSHCWSKLTLNRCLGMLAIIVGGCLACAISMEPGLLKGVMLGVAAVLVVVLLLVVWGFVKLKRLVVKYLPFEVKLARIGGIPLGKMGEWVVGRAVSVFHLTLSIFMSPIRRMHYNAIYNDPHWNNRRITNVVYELTADMGMWKKKWEQGRYPGFLVPSEAIQEVSELASSMGTTLWFTEEDNAKDLPRALLACGQYTICMNLLEYIWKLKASDENTTESHKAIQQCEEQLMENWWHFQQDPYWMAPI